MKLHDERGRMGVGPAWQQAGYQDISVVGGVEAGGGSWGIRVKAERRADFGSVSEAALGRRPGGYVHVRVCGAGEGREGIRRQPTSRQVLACQALPVPPTGKDSATDALESSFLSLLTGEVAGPEQWLRQHPPGAGDKVGLDLSSSRGLQSTVPPTTALVHANLWGSPCARHRAGLGLLPALLARAWADGTHH